MRMTRSQCGWFGTRALCRLGEPASSPRRRVPTTSPSTLPACGRRRREIAPSRGSADSVSCCARLSSADCQRAPKELPAASRRGLIDHLLQYPEVTLATERERVRAERMLAAGSPPPARADGRVGRRRTEPAGNPRRLPTHAPTIRAPTGRRWAIHVLPMPKSGHRSPASRGAVIVRRYDLPSCTGSPGPGGRWTSSNTHLRELSRPPARARRGDVEHARPRARPVTGRPDHALALAHGLLRRQASRHAPSSPTAAAPAAHGSGGDGAR